MVAKDWEEKKVGSDCLVGTRSHFGGDGRVLELYKGGGCTTQ